MAHTEMPRPLLEDTIDRQHPVTPEKPVYLIQRHGIPGAHQKYLDLHLVPPAPRPLRLRLPLAPLAHDSGSAAAPLFLS